MISLELPLREYNLRGTASYYVVGRTWVQVSQAAGQGRVSIPWRPSVVAIDHNPISEEGWWR